MAWYLIFLIAVSAAMVVGRIVGLDAWAIATSIEVGRAGHRNSDD